MSRTRVPEAYRGWAKAAKKQGWTISVAGHSGHLAWRSPDGRTVFTPATGDKFGGVMRVRTKLRHAGLAI